MTISLNCKHRYCVWSSAGARHPEPGERAERNREKEVQKRRLSALCNRSPEMRDFLAANIAAFTHARRFA